ncbi:MAG: hypothetical protein CL859_00015, partial [Cyanobium sp. ARS6]|nr:hypothetical protein [Cyanobium sp. ARS6]
MSAKPPVHKRKEWLPKPAWTACKQIVEKSDLALQTPTDSAKLASVLREIKSHAASCLITYPSETDELSNEYTDSPTFGSYSGDANGYSSDGGGAHDDVTRATHDDEHDTYVDPSPSEELQHLNHQEQAAFNEAHRQMLMIGYDKVSSSEQNDIVEGVLREIGLMMYDDDDDDDDHVNSTDKSDDDTSVDSVGGYMHSRIHTSHPHHDTNLSTTADSTNLSAIRSPQVTSTLLISLLGSGMTVEQICAIYDTGASKPFVKTLKECIRGILIKLPKSNSVTTATSNATATSMSLRRYNFAITDEMKEEAYKYGIDFKDADVITILAAPLVCEDFQHDFDIVSGAVFKDLGAIIHQERWHSGKEYLSFRDSPDIRTEMGHRTNGLPFLRLVPDQFVVDNNLKRIHHHTLEPYQDSEGLRLLKSQWHVHDPKGVYVTALDQCMTLAYSGSLTSPPMSTVTATGATHALSASIASNSTGAQRMHPDSSSPNQDRGGVMANTTAGTCIPKARPRFGNHSQVHSKRNKNVTFSKQLEYQTESQSITPSKVTPDPKTDANERPSVQSSERLRGEIFGPLVHSGSKRRDHTKITDDTTELSVTLVCAGLSSPIFMSQATTNTTQKNQFTRLNMKVEIVIESKSDLTDFAKLHSRVIKVFRDLRDLVKKLESGLITREQLYTDIVEATCPCYAETTMAVYNELQAQPHPDADLFLRYLCRYLKIVKPEAVFCEMTPPHLLSDSSHEQVVEQLQQLGYHVNVTDRLPSCYCGDYTHRDRWFAIGFLNPGPSYNLLEYCTTSPLPAVDILDPVCVI